MAREWYYITKNKNGANVKKQLTDNDCKSYDQVEHAGLFIGGVQYTKFFGVGDYNFGILDDKFLSMVDSTPRTNMLRYGYYARMPWQNDKYLIPYYYKDGNTKKQICLVQAGRMPRRLYGQINNSDTSWTPFSGNYAKLLGKFTTTSSSNRTVYLKRGVDSTGDYLNIEGTVYRASDFDNGMVPLCLTLVFCGGGGGGSTGMRPTNTNKYYSGWGGGGGAVAVGVISFSDILRYPGDEDSFSVEIGHHGNNSGGLSAGHTTLKHGSLNCCRAEGGGQTDNSRDTTSGGYVKYTEGNGFTLLSAWAGGVGGNSGNSDSGATPQNGTARRQQTGTVDVTSSSYLGITATVVADQTIRPPLWVDGCGADSDKNPYNSALSDETGKGGSHGSGNWRAGAGGGGSLGNGGAGANQGSASSVGNGYAGGGGGGGCVIGSSTGYSGGTGGRGQLFVFY